MLEFLRLFLLEVSKVIKLPFDKSVMVKGGYCEMHLLGIELSLISEFMQF